MRMTVNDTFVQALMFGSLQYMDHSRINYNHTARLFYSWNRLLTVITKLLPFKNNNCVHERHVYHSKQGCFHSV